MTQEIESLHKKLDLIMAATQKNKESVTELVGALMVMNKGCEMSNECFLDLIAYLKSVV